MTGLRLLRTRTGWFVETAAGPLRVPDDSTSALTGREDLPEFLTEYVGRHRAPDSSSLQDVLPPIDRQEVWAAGVTYLRSRTARMEESRVASGARFYDLVYEADRPELFFKAAAWRVKGPDQDVRIRRDAVWNVPEPEIALLVSPSGRILGYTAGNDMSSRDIEGENPLYLPQAKVYDGSCSLGPAIVVGSAPGATTGIHLEIRRGGRTAFSGSTTVAQMKRDFQTLVDY